jgi:hypothetical protein
MCGGAWIVDSRPWRRSQKDSLRTSHSTSLVFPDRLKRTCKMHIAALGTSARRLQLRPRFWKVPPWPMILRAPGDLLHLLWSCRPRGISVHLWQPRWGGFGYCFHSRLSTFSAPGSRHTIKCRECKLWSHSDCVDNQNEFTCQLCLDSVATPMPSVVYGARQIGCARIIIYSIQEPSKAGNGVEYFYRTTWLPTIGRFQREPAGLLGFSINTWCKKLGLTSNCR